MKIKAVGAYSAKQPLEPMDITRREPGPNDVKIDMRRAIWSVSAALSTVVNIAKSVRTGWKTTVIT